LLPLETYDGGGYRDEAPPGDVTRLPRSFPLPNKRLGEKRMPRVFVFFTITVTVFVIAGGGAK